MSGEIVYRLTALAIAVAHMTMRSVAAVALSGLALFIGTHATLAGNWSPLVEHARAGTLFTSGPHL